MPQAHTWLRHFTAFYSDLSNPDKVHQRANSIRTQWSFRKTGTMGTLASQAETDAWVQAPGSAGTYGRGVAPSRCGSPGISPSKNLDTAYAKSCNPEHFWPENGSQCRP